MECVRLIIGGGREREGGRGKRSVDRSIQNNLGGREGTAMLGTKRGRSRRLPALPTPREVASLHSDYNPTPQNPKEFSRWGRGAIHEETVTQKTSTKTGGSRSRGGSRNPGIIDELNCSTHVKTGATTNRQAAERKGKMP